MKIDLGKISLLYCKYFKIFPTKEVSIQGIVAKDVRLLLENFFFSLDMRFISSSKIKSMNNSKTMNLSCAIIFKYIFQCV